MFYYPLTDSIRLEVSEVYHAEGLFRIVEENRDALSKWFDWVRLTKSAEDMKQYIKERKEDWGKNQGLVCTIISDDVPIGTIGVHEFNRTNNSACFGYYLDPKYEGKGIMTLAAKALIKYAFEKENMNKVILRCSTINTKSRRVAERLGMKLEGILQQEEIVNENYVDLMQFCLLKSDYDEANKQNN